MKFRKIIFLVLLSLPISSEAQNNKKAENNGISEKSLKSEAYFVDGMKYYITETYDKAIALFKKATEANPTSSGINYMMGKAYDAINDLTNATIYSEKALKIDDSNKFYRKLLGEIYAKQKRFKEAAEMYEKLADKFPQDVDNYFDLSNIYLLQNKFSDAVDVYDKIERTIGISEDITRQKQLIYLKQNKLEKAIEEGNRLIESEPSEPGHVVQQAQILISNERYEQAITILKKNLDFPEAHVLLAEIYRKQNNLDKCNEELQSAFANKNLPTEVKFKILSSYMLMMKEDNSGKTLENLLKLTEELIRQSPNEAKSYVVLGDLLLKKGEMSAARDNYIKASVIDKSVFEVWVAIVELDAKLNHLDSLSKHSEEAIEYFPNQSFFWYHNGFANFVRKDYEKALSSLEEARSLSTDNPELNKHTHALLGDIYNELKQYVAADEAYETVLKADPNYEHVLNNYSYFLSLRKDKLSRAIELSTRLTDRFGNNATYLDTHAWVLYARKEYSQARIFLERAIGQEKDISGTIIEHYGDILFQLGEKDKAIEQWKKARSMGENSMNIDRKIQTGILIE